MKESSLQSKILKRLKLRMDVVWVNRTPSMRIGGYKIGEAGQPDITAIFEHKSNLYLLFLEVKVNTDRLRYEQKKFFSRMEKAPKTLCRVINDISQLSSIIKELKTL